MHKFENAGNYFLVNIFVINGVVYYYRYLKIILYQQKYFFKCNFSFIQIIIYIWLGK